MRHNAKNTNTARSYADQPAQDEHNTMGKAQTALHVNHSKIFRLRFYLSAWLKTVCRFARLLCRIIKRIPAQNTEQESFHPQSSEEKLSSALDLLWLVHQLALEQFITNRNINQADRNFYRCGTAGNDIIKLAEG